MISKYIILSFLCICDAMQKEESSDWAKRTIDVAFATEDADAITEMHEAVLGKRVFAVDGPDGEHDLEDLVSFLSCSTSFGNDSAVGHHSLYFCFTHKIQILISHDT